MGPAAFREPFQAADSQSVATVGEQHSQMQTSTLIVRAVHTCSSHFRSELTFTNTHNYMWGRRKRNLSLPKKQLCLGDIFACAMSRLSESLRLIDGYLSPELQMEIVLFYSCSDTHVPSRVKLLNCMHGSIGEQHTVLISAHVCIFALVSDQITSSLHTCYLGCVLGWRRILCTSY